MIAQIRSGKLQEKREWVLPMLVAGLDEPMQQARITAYSTRCADGGGPRTRWGTKVRVGECAADPRYWGPGSVIWIGDPVNQVMIIEDTGSAIKGPHRFDVSTGNDAAAARRIGVRRANYVVLHKVAPRRSWGACPADWHPPILTSAD
jgi:3D (Asp-Asp-Asp) domain-containing protein